jgi:hypothetical protein
MIEDEQSARSVEPAPPETWRSRVGWLPLIIVVAGVSVLALIAYALFS